MSEALSIFDDSDLSLEKATQYTTDTLMGSDDGELFFELKRSEAISLDVSKAQIDDHQKTIN